jgi:hypothetical protein
MVGYNVKPFFFQIMCHDCQDEMASLRTFRKSHGLHNIVMFCEFGLLGLRGMLIMMYESFQRIESRSSFFRKMEKGHFAELMLIRKQKRSLTGQK